MFTGIIEQVGKVVSSDREGGNLKLAIQAKFTSELKVDQSVAHNGICLTVDGIRDDHYTVTAIAETLSKTNLGNLVEGSNINLERCMIAGDRLDGHIVQGHVDQTATCEEIIERDGSWEFTFEYDVQQGNITVEKGSICVNGVSLTAFNSQDNRFSVAIIPFTYEHTNFQDLSVGDVVNLEFDIIGKYVEKLVRKQQ
ncbi:MAG: riboflavin synthase [Flavobacteriales bacterium]|nr:riboflavin synthase [Flavobacteriales bacterium]